MKGRHSIYFYARLALSAQFLLLALVVAFVLTGASYQSAAIRALRDRAQRMQILNLTVLNEYLDAAGAMRNVTPALAAERYIFPTAELLRSGHFFKSLTPGQNASYASYISRYLAAVGL